MNDLINSRTRNLFFLDISTMTMNRLILQLGKPEIQSNDESDYIVI